MSGGLMMNSSAPRNWSTGRGVASRISSAPNTPCSAYDVVNQSPMNWKIGGSRESSGLNRNAAAGMESVRPMELPTGQMCSGVAPIGHDHGLAR